MPAAHRFPATTKAIIARAVIAKAVTGTAALIGAVAAVAVPLLLLGGCAQKRTTCGDPSPWGGPPVIATMDGELCEAARLRVADTLGKLTTLYPEQAERYRDMTWSWEDSGSLDGLLRRVREEAGDEIAAAMSLAIDQVRLHSSKPPRADCKSEERCLVKGAALGARIAFDDAAGILLMIRRAQGGLRSESPATQ